MRDTFLIIGMIGKFDEIINATNCPRQMDIKINNHPKNKKFKGRKVL